MYLKHKSVRMPIPTLLFTLYHMVQIERDYWFHSFLLYLEGHTFYLSNNSLSVPCRDHVDFKTEVTIKTISERFIFFLDTLLLALPKVSLFTGENSVISRGCFNVKLVSKRKKVVEKKE